MCDAFCERSRRGASAIQRRGVVIRPDDQLCRPRLGSGAFHDIRAADQPVEFVACIDDPEEVRILVHDRKVTDERSMAFVGIDGGEIEEPLVESLEVIPLDLYRMVKYRLDEVVNRFGDETKVQSCLPLTRGGLQDGDYRLGG